MGEFPSRVFAAATWRQVDAIDLLTVSGFVSLSAGVWLAFGAAYALIVAGMILMALGLSSLRGAK